MKGRIRKLCLSTSAVLLLLSGCGAGPWYREYHLCAFMEERKAGRRALSRSDLELARAHAGRELSHASWLGGFHLGIAYSDQAEIAQAGNQGKEAESNYRLALKSFQQSLAAARPAERRLAENDFCITASRLAGILARRGDYASAEALYRQAVQLYLPRAADACADYLLASAFVEALVGWGDTLTRLGRDKEALGSYERALVLARQTRLSDELSREITEKCAQLPGGSGYLTELEASRIWEACMQEGRQAMDSHAYPGAENVYRSALAQAGKFSQKDRRLALTYERLAEVYLKLGEFKRAGDNGQQALALLDARGDENSVAADNALELLVNLGTSYSTPEELKSLLVRQLALRSRIYGSDSMQVGETALDVCNLMLTQSRPSAANRYALAAYNVFDKYRQSKRRSAVNMWTLGKYFATTGDFKRAERMFEQAQRIYRLREQTAGIAIQSFELSALYSKEGNSKRSTSIFNEGIGLTNELEDIDKVYLCEVLLDIARRSAPEDRLSWCRKTAAILANVSPGTPNLKQRLRELALYREELEGKAAKHMPRQPQP